MARLIPSRDAVVLDYGCGEALSADRVAARCARLYLCDAAPIVRERLRARFASEPRIAVLAPEEVDDLAAASLDLVVANSVIQYLGLDEFRGFLGVARAKLKPDGSLVVADVIPHDVNPVTDAGALLSFAWKGGFVGAALVGLARTAASEYRKLREELGLAQYDEAEIVEILADAGFSAERLAENIGHNQARMTFRARPLP
jgi:SAM-dependent methyltransferase